MAVGLVAGSALSVAAQSDESSGPITYVTGVRTGTESVDMANQTVDADGVLHLEDVSIVQSIDWSDPRLPATMSGRGNTDVYGEQGDPNGAVVFTGSLRLQDDEGSWTGTQVGYFGPDGMFTATVTLEGSEAYEGLSAILYQSYADAQAQQDDIPSWEGIIVDGPLPAYMDPPEPLGE